MVSIPAPVVAPAIANRQPLRLHLPHLPPHLPPVSMIFALKSELLASRALALAISNARTVITATIQAIHNMILVPTAAAPTAPVAPVPLVVEVAPPLPAVFLCMVLGTSPAGAMRATTLISVNPAALVDVSQIPRLRIHQYGTNITRFQTIVTQDIPAQVLSANALMEAAAAVAVAVAAAVGAAFHRTPLSPAPAIHLRPRRMA